MLQFLSGVLGMDFNVVYAGHKVLHSLDLFASADSACRELLLAWDSPEPPLE